MVADIILIINAAFSEIDIILIIDKEKTGLTGADSGVLR
jgi:hypothetical protein